MDRNARRRMAALCAFCAAAILLAFGGMARAEDQDPRFAIFDGRYWRGYFDSLIDIVKTPIAPDVDTQLRNGLVLGATGALIFGLDGRIKRFAQDHRSPLGDDFAKVGNDVGAAQLLAGASLGVYGIGETIQNKQLRNAEAFAAAGAARLVPDAEMSGERLVAEVRRLAGEAGLLEKMGDAARAFAKPDAARRAAEVLEGFSVETI